jgi:multisubunit Na+/H+ antiporter MnhC subunit
MTSNFPGHTQVQYTRALLAARMAAFRAARERSDLGASAIELAIITAIVVGLAVVVLVIVTQVVNTRSQEIGTNNGKIP